MSWEPAWNPARHRASSPRRPAAVDLAHLVAGRNCSAVAITNVGRIVGQCMNSNSLYTGVVWAAARTSVQALQALVGGVRSR